MSIWLLLLTMVLECLRGAEQLFPGEDWHSAFVELDSQGSSLFYILFKSRAHNPQAPLIVWLNGGPGCGSELGLLLENGPYQFVRNLSFTRNVDSWNSFADIMYLDQPLGTGFSRAPKASLLCRNVSCVARNFCVFFLKFLDSQPSYRGRPLYLSGESFGGFYVSAIGSYLLHVQHPDVNLRGVTIGNGDLDLTVQLGSGADFLYSRGRFAWWQYPFARLQCLLCQLYVSSGQLWRPLSMCDVEDHDTFGWLIKIVNPHDITDNETDSKAMRLAEAFLNRAEVQWALGLNEHVSYALCSQDVEETMTFAENKVTAQLGHLLNHDIPVLLYYGDNDLADDWLGAQAVALATVWKGQKRFQEAPVLEWRVEGHKAGEERRYANFRFLRVFNGSHTLPRAVPHRALEMIREFISDTL